MFQGQFCVLSCVQYKTESVKLHCINKLAKYKSIQLYNLE